MRSPSSAPLVNGLDGSTEITPIGALGARAGARRAPRRASTCRRRAARSGPTLTARPGVRPEVADHRRRVGGAVLEQARWPARRRGGRRRARPRRSRTACGDGAVGRRSRPWSVPPRLSGAAHRAERGTAEQHDAARSGGDQRAGTAARGRSRRGRRGRRAGRTAAAAGRGGGRSSSRRRRRRRRSRWPARRATGATSDLASPPGTEMWPMTSEMAIAAPRASEKKTTRPA